MENIIFDLKEIFDIEAKIVEEYEEGSINYNNKYIKILSKNSEIGVKYIESLIKKEEEGYLKNAKENFISDILDFRFEDIDLMLNRSEILGYDFYIKRRAVLIEIENMYTILKDKDELILQHYKDELSEVILQSTKNQKDIVSYIGRNRFILCKAEDGEIYEIAKNILKNLNKKWDLNFKIAIGDIYDMPGLEAMAYSYKDSLKYMNSGKRFLKDISIYSFKNTSIYFLLDNIDRYEARKIINFIEPVIEYGEKERIDIYEIFSKFFSNNLVVTKTGDDTGLGAKRVKKIIDDISRLLKLDIVKFETATKLYLALKYWKSRQG